jgi:hypothetical protein
MNTFFKMLKSNILTNKPCGKKTSPKIEQKTNAQTQTVLKVCMLKQQTIRTQINGETQKRPT